MRCLYDELAKRRFLQVGEEITAINMCGSYRLDKPVPRPSGQRDVHASRKCVIMCKGSWHMGNELVLDDIVAKA